MVMQIKLIVVVVALQTALAFLHKIVDKVVLTFLLCSCHFGYDHANIC